MNGTLNLLAAIATPAAPADPWTSPLGGLPALVAGGVIGYLLGILRDASKAKSERLAKHHDEVLEAATGLLVTTGQVQRAAAMLFYKNAAANNAERKFPKGSLDLENELKKTGEEFWVAASDLAVATELTKPHALRISILAPSMEALTDKVVEVASNPGIAGGTARARELQAEYAAATREFTSAIRTYLKVPSLRRVHNRQVP